MANESNGFDLNEKFTLSADYCKPFTFLGMRCAIRFPHTWPAAKDFCLLFAFYFFKKRGTSPLAEPDRPDRPPEDGRAPWDSRIWVQHGSATSRRQRRVLTAVLKVFECLLSCKLPVKLLSVSFQNPLQSESEHETDYTWNQKGFNRELYSRTGTDYRI